MVNAMVERATSDVLVGPDWSINIGICDTCNRDPGQAKDVVKGIKKRVGNKNVKVQLLALTLLETIVKNCGDLVHKHVAKRDLLRDMVKIVKKKPDYHVKEKILILIDTWQEAFGGARARYPEYHAAYSELLHMGILFPKRTETSPPIFTPLQTQPLMRNPENESDAVESSAEAECSTSRHHSTEIQKARDIMKVLAKMLIAIDPETKEGLRQEVVVDLVLQCRTYKKRVVHLVNSTLDESLLCEGLALNDELQRVLDKHEALVSGVSAPSEKLKPETSQALVPVEPALIDSRERQNPGSTAGAGEEMRFLAPMITNGSSATPGMVNRKFDLLSGDDFSTSTTQNFLAIVPLGEPEPATSVSEQNVMSKNNKPQSASAGQPCSSSPQFQRSQHFSSKKPIFNVSESLPNKVPPQLEPTSQYTQGSIPVAGRTCAASPTFEESQPSSAASPTFEESQPFASQQPSFHPKGNIDNMVTSRYESMSLHTHGSTPVAGQRYSSLPQVQHFLSQQPSFNQNGSLPVILPPKYGSRFPIAKQAYPSPQLQPPQHFASQPPSFNPNGSLTSKTPLQCEPISPYSQESSPPWHDHTSQQQQPSSLVYGNILLNGHTPRQRHPSSPVYGNILLNGHTPQQQQSSSPVYGNILLNGHTPQQLQQSSLVYAKTLLNGHTSQQQQSSSPVYGKTSLNGHTSQHKQPSSPVYCNTLLNGHMPPQQQPSSTVHGAQTRHGELPPPPWEAQPTDKNQSGGMHYLQPQGLQTLGNNNNQATGMYMQQHIIGSTSSPMRHEAIHPQQHITGCPISPMRHEAIHPQQQVMAYPPSPMNQDTIHLEQTPQQQFQEQHTMGVLPHYQMAYMCPQQIPQQMYSDPLAQASGYGGGYRYSYGYTPPQHGQFLNHRMSLLSVRDDGFLNSTVYSRPSISNAIDLHMQSLNPSKPEDILFEDLVDLTNVKPNKSIGEK